MGPCAYPMNVIAGQRSTNAPSPPVDHRALGNGVAGVRYHLTPMRRVNGVQGSPQTPAKRPSRRGSLRVPQNRIGPIGTIGASLRLNGQPTNLNGPRSFEVST